MLVIVAQDEGLDNESHQSSGKEQAQTVLQAEGKLELVRIPVSLHICELVEQVDMTILLKSTTKKMSAIIKKKARFPAPVSCSCRNLCINPSTVFDLLVETTANTTVKMIKTRVLNPQPVTVKRALRGLLSEMFSHIICLGSGAYAIFTPEKLFELKPLLLSSYFSSRSYLSCSVFIINIAFSAGIEFL